MKGRAEDEAFECLCIQAQHDAFWHLSSKTVAGHVREVRFIERYAAALGVTRPFPRLGPYKIGEDLGMQTALMLLFRSQEPGRDGTFKKHRTARKIRSALSVIWDCSPDSGEDMTLASGSVKGRFVVTKNPSEGRWYQFFTTGCSARMGDVVTQDRAYTIEVLRKLLEMYEQEWEESGFEMGLHSLCACMVLLLTCLGGMRGFEAVWTDLAALCYEVEYCERADDESGVAWPIVGRFKSHHGRVGCYMIPIAGTTDSGIKFFRWTQRFVVRLAMEGREDGWAFQRADGTRAKAGDYWANIAAKLELIQATTSLIDRKCDVWEDYGIQRSGRRCFTTHCGNMGVSPHLVELQARWQTDRAAGVRSVRRTMLHTYSEIRNMMESLLKPSQVF